MEEQKKTYDDDDLKGVKGIIDWAGQWIAFPLAVYTAYKADALKAAKEMLEGIYEQGKDTFDRNKAVYKLILIKPINIALIVTAIFLAILDAVVVALPLEQNVYVSGLEIFSVLFPCLIGWYVLQYAQPFPIHAKNGDVYPDVIEGGNDPHPMKGLRVVENIAKISLEKVSLAGATFVIAIAGYGTALVFIFIGFLGKSCIPTIIGFLAYVVTRKGTRAIMRVATWLIEKSGEFVAWAAGKLRTHIAVIEAGVTYKNLERKKLELGLKQIWQIYLELEASFGIGFLTLVIVGLPWPNPLALMIVGMLLLLFLAGGIMYDLVGQQEQNKVRRLEYAQFVNKRLLKFSLFTIPVLIVLRQTDIFSAKPFKNLACMFFDPHALWSRIGILVASILLLFLLFKSWRGMIASLSKDRERQKDPDQYKNTEKGAGFVFLGVATVLVVVGLFSGTNILLITMNSDFAFCKAEVTAPAEAKQEAAPVASAPQQASKQENVPVASSAPIVPDPAEERIEEISVNAGKIVNKSPPSPAKLRITTVTVDKVKAPPEEEEPVKTVASESVDSEGRVSSFRAYRERRRQR